MRTHLSGKSDKVLEWLDNLQLERRLLLSLEDGVHFACDAVLLTPEISRQIDRFVNNLYRNDDVKVVIVGHSDNVGSEA